MNELDEYLDFLFQRDEGYVYSPRAIRGHTWEEKYFQWPSQKEQLKDWIQTETHEYDVYLAPALFKSKVADKENVKLSNVVWLEYDGQAVDYKRLPEPDCVVKSGTDGHLHCYWKVDPTNSSEVIEDVNRRLTYYLRADTSGWDATQVLRPPGTINHKNGQVTELLVCDEPTFKHRFDAFDLAPEVKEKPVLFSHDELLDPAKLLRRLKPDVVELLTKSPAPVGTRSTFLMNVGYVLARAGLSPLEAVTLLWHVDNRVKKFVGRSDQLRRLGEIVGIAIARYERATNIQGYSPLEIVNHANDLEWRMNGWLHTRGILLITGQPGVGKTQLSLDIGRALSVGETDLLGVGIKQSRVVFLSLEMMLEELKYIFLKQAAGLEQSSKLNEWSKNMRIFPVVDEGTFEAYEKIFEKERPEVVIIDSLSELSTDDLKEAEARALMKWLSRMRTKYNHAQIIIHHNRKAQGDNKKPNKLSDLYGSFIFAKRSETVLCLWHDDKNPDESEMELIPLKVRFGKKVPVLVRRTEHLTFEMREGKPVVSQRFGEIEVAIEASFGDN